MRKFLTILIAALCVAASSAAPASAHLGDWWTQYQTTYNRSASWCNAHWNPYGYSCPRDTGAPGYDGSGQYGEHSRYFVWRWPTAGGRWCVDTFYIGHDYYIFAQYHDCR